LGEINDGQMILNQYGAIVKDIWAGLPDRVSDIDLDEYVIMLLDRVLVGSILRGEALPTNVGSNSTRARKDE
jgi:hypothetical protein